MDFFQFFCRNIGERHFFAVSLIESIIQIANANMENIFPAIKVGLALLEGLGHTLILIK